MTSRRPTGEEDVTSQRTTFRSLMASALDASSENEDDDDEFVDIFTSTERQ